MLCSDGDKFKAKDEQPQQSNVWRDIFNSPSAGMPTMMVNGPKIVGATVTFWRLMERRLQFNCPK